MIQIKPCLYLFFCASFFFGPAFAEESSTANGSQTTSTEKQLKPNLEAGKKAYELCATCHYANGWGKEDGSFPSIAGQHSSVIKKQLADFRSKDRDNPTMFPFTDDATLGGAQGIEDVTAYISQLPANPTTGKGEGDQLEKGEQLFIEKCAACHGKYAEGNKEAVFPRLQGQHYGYMLRQLQWIRDGLRKNANPAMLVQIKTMDDATLASIADYVSRIKEVSEQVSSKPQLPIAEKEIKATSSEEPDCD